MIKTIEDVMTIKTLSRSDLIIFSKHNKRTGNRLIELYDIEQEENPDNIEHISCSMEKFIDFMKSSYKIFNPKLTTTFNGVYASWKSTYDPNKLFSLHFQPNTIKYVILDAGRNSSGEIDIREIEALLENNSMNDVVYEMGT